jgi:hypothetical protein
LIHIADENSVCRAGVKREVIEITIDEKNSFHMLIATPLAQVKPTTGVDTRYSVAD